MTRTEITTAYSSRTYPWENTIAPILSWYWDDTATWLEEWKYWWDAWSIWTSYTARTIITSDYTNRTEITTAYT